MKNSPFLFVVLCLSSLLFTAPVRAEETLYVQPYRAKIFMKPSITSEVLGSVDSGFQFAPSGNEGRWVKLFFKSKLGYIPAAQTAKSPPLGKSFVQGAEVAPKLSIRSRTSSAPAVVAGMKGLTYEDRARITQGERSDFEALDKVNLLEITPDELSLFQLEGGKR